MRVHVIQVGRLRFPRGWFESRSGRDLLRTVRKGVGGKSDEIPVLSYVIEHDDGHIVIDTGFHHSVAKRLKRHAIAKRLVDIKVDAGDNIGSQMRGRGLRPEDVRLVLPTHMDMDHAGGIEYFPNAEVRVHRPEWKYRHTLGGRIRFQQSGWPKGFSPTVYELESTPFGPFVQSLAVHDCSGVTIVPTPGHSKGHVGIVVQHNGATLFFGGDHMIRQSWFARDMAHGIEPLNIYRKLARDTNERIKRFVADTPTIILPSHDADAAEHLGALEPLKI